MATAKGSDILRDFLQNGIDPTKDELVEDNAESLQESPAIGGRNLHVRFDEGEGSLRRERPSLLYWILVAKKVFDGKVRMGKLGGVGSDSL